MKLEIRIRILFVVTVLLSIFLVEGSETFAQSLRPVRSTVQRTRIVTGKISPWRPLFRGISMAKGKKTGTLPVEVRALRINLWDPTISFFVTPSNGKEPLDSAARTTSEFLAEFKCQAAINGSVFSAMPQRKWDAVNVLGISLSNGDLYSKANKYHALLISRDRKAWIASPPFNLKRAYNGLSGYYTILKHGRIIGSQNARHPRSAVGVSRDGRYLILMTIDGRHAGYSEGATLGDTAAWLKRFGAYHGLNLDGGGSTTLVIEAPDGSPHLLNRPAGTFERRVANHLGVYAKPLTKKKRSWNLK